MRVIIFFEVGLVVFKGVVLFGYKFVIISFRVVKFIYGVVIIMNFNFNIYLLEKKKKYGN